MPSLQLGFCIYREIAAFVHDHTNRLTAFLPMDIFSAENSCAKSSINAGASKDIGIQQLGRRLLIDVVCEQVGKGSFVETGFRKSYR